MSNILIDVALGVCRFDGTCLEDGLKATENEGVGDGEGLKEYLWRKIFLEGVKKIHALQGFVGCVTADKLNEVALLVVSEADTVAEYGLRCGLVSRGRGIGGLI